MTENDGNKLTPDIRYHLIKKMERHKVIALAGTSLLEHEAKYLEFHGVSGVVLFQRNVESLTQVGELIGGVTEQLAASGLPPLVMADHEGDFVSELKKIIGVPPSAMAIAATGDLDLARDVARETGLAMKKLGVNVVLAPVADCFLELSSPVTGLRTFGRSPDSVADFVASTISGFHDSGVIVCVKHFPGHGCTAEDSHETLPEVVKSLDDLRREDLVPFRRAVDEGAEMVMISHVAYPMGGDTLVPASFDTRVMKDLLREEIGFDGVAITDSLEMAGARWYARGQFGEGRGGFERSLLAGADLLMHTKPVPEAVEVEGSNEPLVSINVMETIVRTLEKVVDRGRIDEKIAEAAEGNKTLRDFLAILDRSYERVAALRRKVARQLAGKPKPARHGKVIQFDAYPSVPSVYRDVAEKSIAVREGDFGSEIVAPGGHCVVVPVECPAGPSLKKHDMDAFVDVLCRHFTHWRRTDVVTGFGVAEDGELYPEVQTGPRVIDATRYTGQESYGFHVTGDEDVIVAFSCRGYPAGPFLDQLGAFLSRFEPVAVLVLGWPVLDWIPDGAATVLCYGGSSHVASAAARVLAGEIEPQGLDQGLWPV
jgi:beta-glucosidase-like glycosyl hydrolase